MKYPRTLSDASLRNAHPYVMAGSLEKSLACFQVLGLKKFELHNQVAPLRFKSHRYRYYYGGCRTIMGSGAQLDQPRRI